MSPEKENPHKTPVHLLLGERILEICDLFRLDDKGKKTVDRILERWQEAPRSPAEKMAIIMEEVTNRSEERPISFALLAIINEFTN